MRLPLLLALSCAFLGLAPAARAQTSAPAPLATTVGDPIAYRIDLPKDWEISRVSQNVPNGTAHALSATGKDGALSVTAADLVAGRTDRPAGVSEAQMRKMVTDMILGSDSLMYGMLQGAIANQGGTLRDAVRGITTLAGQRAARLKGRVERDGTTTPLELHLTVRDGIMYVITTLAEDGRYAAVEPLFARIRDSFVLAPAPR